MIFRVAWDLETTHSWAYSPAGSLPSWPFIDYPHYKQGHNPCYMPLLGPTSLQVGLQVCPTLHTQTPYMHVYLYMYIQLVHVYTYLYICAYIHMYPHMYIHMYIHIYIYICTYMCMYIYIYEFKSKTFGLESPRSPAPGAGNDALVDGLRPAHCHWCCQGIHRLLVASRGPKIGPIDSKYVPRICAPACFFLVGWASQASELILTL